MSMANKSIGSPMIREIIRMKDNGLSNNQISKSLGKSRTTIIKYLGLIEASGICLKELLELKGEELSELFEVPSALDPFDREQIHKDLYSIFPYVEKELKRVGVSRQYAGVIGKVDNCQVGVYASLVNGESASIVNQRIFLPKAWTNDDGRCQEAKIPDASRIYKTKPELALEMIKQDIASGVSFDWIGGDGLYGHNTKLCDGLDELKLFFVMDVHKDETVFLEEPLFSIPMAKAGAGRKPTKLKASCSSVRLDKLQEGIPDDEWKLENIRNTVKGKLRLWVYKKEVWIWDGESSTAKKRVLLITKTTDPKPKVKYSVSNGDIDTHNHGEYAYFVSQRYWVERTFDNAKNELGMSDYQIRKWQSWHTHHAIIMLASLLITTKLIECKKEIPLLSFKDARILIVTQICTTQIEMEQKIRQMQKRHIKRKADIDWNYNKQKLEKSTKLSS